MTPPVELLSRKEIAALFKRNRITVYRWEREGLRLVDGRASAGAVAWFLELRDAARELGMDTRAMARLPREVQTRYLAEALAARTGATSCNIAERDSAHASS